jgi:CheY-like chemotaxis protein
MKSKEESTLKNTPVSDTGQAGKIETAMLFKNQFIANMTFQIRTLSNAIIGFSDLLRYEQLTDSQKEYVAEIYQAGQGVVSLVDDVLELAKIQSGQRRCAVVNCSLVALLDKIDLLIRPLTNENGLEFEISQCTDLPATIRTDPDMLRQCLINLTGNAIKFTEKGCIQLKVSVEYSHAPASPDASRGGGNDTPFVRFDVVDTGIGISADKQKIIFEPFAQLKNTDEIILTSSGLGLTITAHLAKLLGGEVSVTSKVGKGSVFSLVVPAGVDIESEPLLDLSPREQRQPEQYLPEEFDTASQPGGELVEPQKCIGHVLLVEDQPSNRTVMSLLLETMGLRVSVAEDGIEAVEKAMGENHAPASPDASRGGGFDLILMDIRMPRMDGYEARRTLQEKGLATPIIALTATSPSDDPDGHKLSEFDGYLMKPVDSKKLYQVIAKYLPLAGQTSPAKRGEYIS